MLFFLGIFTNTSMDKSTKTLQKFRRSSGFNKRWERCRFCLQYIQRVGQTAYKRRSIGISNCDEYNESEYIESEYSDNTEHNDSKFNSSNLDNNNCIYFDTTGNKCAKSTTASIFNFGFC